MTRLVVLMLLVGVLVPSVTVAQETPLPEAGAQSSRYLPKATAFGTDWKLTDTTGLQVPSDIFREGSRAVYGGPNGARVAVLVLLATDARVAVRQSWEEATKTFDQYRYALAEHYDYTQSERLDAMDPPSGCVEAKRAEGQDERFGYTAGITLCAIDPDIIVLAAASGDVAKENGYSASDQVILAAIKAEATAS
jgi:hypothetical protein